VAKENAAGWTSRAAADVDAGPASAVREDCAQNRTTFTLFEPGREPEAVLVAAHPDDEVIGAASQLARLRPVIVHVTDGAPRDMRDASANGFSSREDYARARRAELECALALAGLGLEQTRELGIADQEASLNLEGLARRLAEVLTELKPEAVLTHPYEGGHPDHDATAFAVHAACRLAGLPAAAIVEFTSYHAGSRGIEVFEFLPDAGSEIGTVFLSVAERVRKQAMIECFTTQREMLRQFPVDLERFRPAPAYDFTLPPHAGLLFYENFEWGMTGGRWRELAREALRRLRLMVPA
jgi:LmbE family N-acetylglucosaminyl deacetylase